MARSSLASRPCHEHRSIIDRLVTLPYEVSSSASFDKRLETGRAVVSWGGCAPLRDCIPSSTHLGRYHQKDLATIRRNWYSVHLQVTRADTLITKRCRRWECCHMSKCKTYWGRACPRKRERAAWGRTSGLDYPVSLASIRPIQRRRLGVRVKGHHFPSRITLARQGMKSSEKPPTDARPHVVDLHRYARGGEDAPQ